MTFERFPVENAYTREVAFAVELLDPTTLEPVREGLGVRATGLVAPPIVNASGQFVWLKSATPAGHVLVDPRDLPFEAEDVPPPVPPARLLRIVLRPRPGYLPASGATAVQSSLYERIQPQPVGVAGVNVWLQWIDDSTAAWIDATPVSATSASGDFIAVLRLRPADEPALDSAGNLRVRLRFDRGGALRASPEFPLKQGRATGIAPFGWDSL